VEDSGGPSWVGEHKQRTVPAGVGYGKRKSGSVRAKKPGNYSRLLATRYLHAFMMVHGCSAAPHFHAYYGENKAIIDIKTCELKEGNLPKKQLKLVLAWAELRQEELLANWTLAMNSELPFKIDPLK